ncbi:cilia- and flagella-associated protein 100 [Prorops nasuta]|uniref:cilia- and flagella-associated protein 100 n=1 Tax=Prorops nasuta TaxID=863751 RepID=UPI0034CD5122
MTDKSTNVRDKKSNTNKTFKKKPLTGIQRPIYTDILFHRRNVPRSRYYFTSGHEHKGEARNVFEERSPFYVPPCREFPGSTRPLKAVEKLPSRKAYDHGATDDIFQRLRLLILINFLVKFGDKCQQSCKVDVDLEILDAKKYKEPNEVIAMTDVDPGYFTDFGGGMREKFSVRRYVDDLRMLFRTRLMIAQERDDCIRIEQQFAEEQTKMNLIEERYEQYVKEFEDFLQKDHEASMKLLGEAEDEAKLTASLINQKNQLSKEFGQVRLDVYFWEESWRTVKVCQKFLYQIAPTAWRAEHDWIHRVDNELQVSSNDDLFADYKLDTAVSLDDLIDGFENDISNEGPKDLYFTEVSDLQRVFLTMETQNLNAMIHLETLAAPMADMTSTIARTEAEIKREVDEVVAVINDLEDAILKNEERATKLAEYADQLSKGVFKEAESSEEVRKLRVYVEDAYEECVSSTDAKLDIFGMMRGIERVYEDLNKILVEIPAEILLLAEREVKRQENKLKREALEAAKEELRMKRILDAQRRIMQMKFKGKKIVFRSPPIRRKVVTAAPPPEPTKEELAFLEFFTDYCSQDNFLEYRQNFPEDFMAIFKDTNLEPDGDEEDDDEDENIVETEDQEN